MRIQPAILIAIGERAAQIAGRFLDHMKCLKLDDGRPYPDFLYQVIVVQDGDGARSLVGAQSLTMDSSPGTSPEAAADDLIPRMAEVLLNARSAIFQKDRLVNLNYTARERHLSEITHYHLVTDVCSEWSNLLYRRIVKAIHDTHEVSQPFHTSSLLLLPGLVAGEELESRRAARAVAYALLNDVADMYGNPRKHGLRESAPNLVWLVDSQDQAGRTMSFEELCNPIAEVLGTMIAEDYFDIGPGEEDRVFSAFGFCQLVFPRDALQKHIVNLATSMALHERILKTPPSDTDDLLLDVSQFVDNQLLVSDICEEVCKGKQGQNIMGHLSVPSRGEEETLGMWLDAVDSASAEFEKRTLPTVEQSVIRRASDVAEEKLRLIQEAISHRVDEGERGLLYAARFVRELTGTSSDAAQDEQSGLVEQLNLATVLTQVQVQTMELLGVEMLARQRASVAASRDEHSREISIAEARRDELVEKIDALTSDLDPESESVDEVTPDDAAADVKGARRKVPQAQLRALTREVDSLDETLATLRKRREASVARLEKIDGRVSKIQAAWEGPEQKAESFAEGISLRKEEVDRTKQKLRKSAESAELTVERIKDLEMSGRRYGRAMATWGAGIALVLSSVPALLASTSGFVGSMGALCWILAAMGIYGVGSFVLYFRRIQNVLKKERVSLDALRNDQKTLESELKEQVADYWHTAIRLRAHVEAIEKLMELRDKASAELKRLEDFASACTRRAKSLSEEAHLYAGSQAKTPVATAQDVAYFYDLAFENDGKDQLARFFARPENRVSEFFRKGEPELIDALTREFRSVAEESLKEVELEECVFDLYDKLTGGFSPEQRLGAFLMSLEPVVRLHSSAFVRDSLHQIIRIGVEDVSESRALPVLRDAVSTGSIDGFSHGDPDRLTGLRILSNFSAKDLARIQEYKAAHEQSLSKQMNAPDHAGAEG